MNSLPHTGQTLAADRAPPNPMKPKILVVCDSSSHCAEFVARMAEHYDVETADDLMRLVPALHDREYYGIFVALEHLKGALEIGNLLQNSQILEGMPDGVAMLDSDNTILWANRRLREWCEYHPLIGANFYSSLANPEILGPDYCPFHMALATGQACRSTLKTADSRYFHVHAAPVRVVDRALRHLIVTVRDVTREQLQQQKLAAIHQAGQELAGLTPEEIFDMSPEERIELLKDNVLHYTKDLLNFHTVEVRLLDAKTGRLDVLLSYGMDEEASQRELYARSHGNGVTGFVAATGKSYLCEDTREDPLYILGVSGARSALTVPLVLHDDVIGTFNVESTEVRAFSESDLQFVEIFCRNLAMALNQLELLAAEKCSAAAASVEAIHRAVAFPVDEILTDAVTVMEQYIGHGAEVTDRLRRILRNARDIKQLIQRVGQRMVPAEALPQQRELERASIQGSHILIVDEDPEVRSSAHDLLERQGCVVETTPTGAQAIFMVRAMPDEDAYDIVISDITLPDMTGYDLMVKLLEIVPKRPLPLVLMTGFGWDRNHTIVKARQAGLRHVLYKPFRLGQLLDTIEKVFTDGDAPS